MSNVIDFLERLGQDSQLRYATGIELEQALTRAGIEPALRTAMLGSDGGRLESLMGATPNICCMINVPEQEDEGGCVPPAGVGKLAPGN
ncbi:MAG: hypothetical protein ACJ8R9_26105 [Steroidobacteraceae bacterium]